MPKSTNNSLHPLDIINKSICIPPHTFSTRYIIQTPLKFSPKPVCQDTHKNVYSDTIFKSVSHRFHFLRRFQSSKYLLYKILPKIRLYNLLWWNRFIGRIKQILPL